MQTRIIILNNNQEKILGFFGDTITYSAGLKDICETRTQHLNIILLSQGVELIITKAT